MNLVLRRHVILETSNFECATAILAVSANFPGCTDNHSLGVCQTIRSRLRRDQSYPRICGSSASSAG